MPTTKNNMRRSEEHSSFSSYSSSSSDEEIDARDLKPIKEYLTNRKELARQLFKSVKPEKIRMMLPQVLKHMDFNELEEWCVSELSGMSKARIVSILNGKPMLESSDTSESDDSGPSLEIISDTEEWTDDDASKKGTDNKGKKKDKTKLKGKARSNNKKNEDKANIKSKTVIKSENSTKDINIKKENDKTKEKEGDSLLDLLELEMRARAIRALIRKEEDIIPSTNSKQTNSEVLENTIKTAQDDAKAKENCRKQLEKIISEQQSLGEDEDVVLVVQPTPVVELLSSDSDGEICKTAQENQNVENKCTAETGKLVGGSDNNMKDSSSHNSKENSTAKTDSNTKSEASTLMPERSIDIKNNTLSISIASENVAEKRKKSKKKSHTKSQMPFISRHSSKSKPISITVTTERLNKENDTNIEQQVNTSDEGTIIEEEASKEEKAAEKNKVEEEKSTDLDEIIELDDYCDVEIGNCEEDKSPERSTTLSEAHKQSTSQVSEAQTDSTTETWASRYYQTDDVQNVIKESKIQSEIRKRLRERQRLSKLSKSPSLGSPSSQSSTTDATFGERVPTGSVEEYLALKRAVSTDANASNDNTVQDNIASGNLSDTTSSAVIADISVKEGSIQDESTSSSQECADSDAQKAVTSETTVTVETTEVDTCTKTEVDTCTQPD